MTERTVDCGKVVTLDVREDLRAGREPFSRIMATVAALSPDQDLLLIAPFEPVPLYYALQDRGFAHRIEQTPTGDWQVLFTPSNVVHSSRSPSPRPSREREGARDSSLENRKSEIQNRGPSSIRLPLAFILTGALSFFAGIAWLCADPSILATYHYNQYVVALTHLFVLGWICSVVMGALYQLVPVAVETRLHSEKLAWLQFGLHLIGFAGMVWMFRFWNMKQVGHFGCVLVLGVGFFVYNIARTLRRAAKWNVTAAAIATALGWLSVTVFAGLCIAVAKCSYSSDIEGAVAPTGAVGGLVHGLRSVALFMRHFDAISAMHAHAHLGAVGCFTILMVGVSYKLIPMFTLSEVQNPRRAFMSVALLNLALAGSFVTILLRSPWKFGFAILGAGALGIYAWELVVILGARQRRSLDWGVRYFLSAIALLLLTSLMGVVLSWPALPLTPFTGQLENLYGFLGIIGVISFAIVGMLYKIVPFLVWFGRYSRQIGSSKVPTLAELYSARLQALGYWSFLAGLAIISPGIVSSSEVFVQLGCGVLGLSAVTFALNLASILSHFWRFRETAKAVQPAPVHIHPAEAGC